MYTPLGRAHVAQPLAPPSDSPRRQACPPAEPRSPRQAAGSADRGHPFERSSARFGSGRAGRGRGRRRHPLLLQEPRHLLHWRGSSAARSGGGTRSAATAWAPSTSPLESNRNSGSEDSISRLAPPRRSLSAAATSTGQREWFGDRRRWLRASRRRSRRAAHSPAVRRSGSGFAGSGRRPLLRWARSRSRR